MFQHISTLVVASYVGVFVNSASDCVCVYVFVYVCVCMCMCMRVYACAPGCLFMHVFFPPSPPPSPALPPLPIGLGR